MPQTTEPKKKKRLVPNVTIAGDALDMASLRMLAEKEPKAFITKCQTLIDGGLRWGDITDLKGLFFALSDVQVPATVNMMGHTRAIMASAFPLLSGGLTVAGINDAMDAVPTIGQDLVTEMDSNKRFSEIAEITSDNPNADGVAEGQDYPEIHAGETKYGIRHRRDGRRIAITAEMIEENDIPDIVRRVDVLGEIAAESVEKQTLRRITDLNGSTASAAEPYVLHMNGTAAALYVATANTPGTRAPSGTRVNNNALVNTTDLEAARTVLAAMLNSRGERMSIPMSRCTLLVPDALAGTALKILGSEQEPSIENEINNWGPRGVYRPRFRSTPRLDDLSTTTWYLGWFEKQFTRKWKLRFEYVTLSGDTQAFLQSRIAFQARIGYDCEIGATGYTYVVQCLDATTAPVP